MDNNYVGNLKWDTAKGNAADRVANGTNHLGEINFNAKLTCEGVREIRKKLAAGMTCAAIAREYGVTDVLIGCVKRGTIWRHVPVEDCATP